VSHQKSTDLEQCKNSCEFITSCNWILHKHGKVCLGYKDCVLTSFMKQDGTADTDDQGIRVYKKLDDDEQKRLERMQAQSPPLTSDWQAVPTRRNSPLASLHEERLQAQSSDVSIDRYYCVFVFLFVILISSYLYVNCFSAEATSHQAHLSLLMEEI